MTGDNEGDQLRHEVKALIRYYDRRGWDWLSALEFTVRRASGTWPQPPCWHYRRGRPRQKRQA
jgi:hypothetical protein